MFFSKKRHLVAFYTLFPLFLFARNDFDTGILFFGDRQRADRPGRRRREHQTRFVLGNVLGIVTQPAVYRKLDHIIPVVQ